MNGDEIVSFPERGGEASHLTYEEMEAWLDGRAGAIDRELAEGHLALCPRCAAELEDLRHVRESLTPPRRWWVPAAAIAAMVLATLWLLLPEPKPEPAAVVATARGLLALPSTETAPAQTTTEPAPRILAKPAILATLLTAPGTLRGTTSESKLRLETPLATVVLDPRPNFRWTAASGANEYTVAVADRETGAGAVTGSTRSTSWRPDEPLARGRTYTWQVTAHVGDDRFTVPRPEDAEALFHVAAEATALEIEALPAGHHLERGLALAERGALDDAERELRRAAEEGNVEAGAYLAEVQSWRAR